PTLRARRAGGAPTARSRAAAPPPPPAAPTTATAAARPATPAPTARSVSLPYLTCPAGWWGANCTQPCRCAAAAACRPNDGYCRCPPGYTGAYCTQCESTLPYVPGGLVGRQLHAAVPLRRRRRLSPQRRVSLPYLTCPAGWWGANCTQPCRCAAAAACRPNDGYCRCPPGYTGAYCTQCESTLPYVPGGLVGRQLHAAVPLRRRRRLSPQRRLLPLPARLHRRLLHAV
ncbi:multiple epidermal growth factor-like domains protein 10, partial [Cydia pomonella]|uniref:multiple epidermal growth factor-like domains protein 10 n=1 Tax=Cydia pomonella TaxID=82600 RepID=UPI002ADE6DDA